MKTDFKIQQSVDARGTRCPIPLLRAKQALKMMRVGECLEVLTTDPSAKPDFDAMLRHLPHTLVDYRSELDSSSDHQCVDTFIICKGD